MGKITQAFQMLYNEHAGELTRSLRKIPSMAETFQHLQSVKGIPEFEVHLPPEIWERIQKGSAYFPKRKDDFLTASVYDAKTGTIIKQVGLSEKSQELFSPEFLSSLNQVSIHTALADISQRLEVIDRKIDNVLQGQRDDRLGLIDSAENLYYLSALTHHPENRRLLLINTVSQGSEGCGRLIREVENHLQEIGKLPTGKGQILISALTKDVNKEARDKAKLLEIELQGILKASYIMAFSCGELDEPLLFQEAWHPLEKLIPKINEARDRTNLWVPDNPYSLPDSFNTLVSLAEGIVKTGKRLVSGEKPVIKLRLTHEMLMDGGE